MVPTEGTVHLLKAWAVQNQVPLANDLHVTLLYSRNALYVKPNTKEISVQPGGFERFGEALVLKLESSELHHRHREFISYGGTHDFDEYRPHMTLCTRVLSIDETKLSPITFSLTFHKEYNEPLDL